MRLTCRSASTARTWSSSTRRRTCGARHPAGDPVRLHARRHLRRAAAACTCSASATSISCSPATLQANPGVNIAALRPYKGYNVIRLAENSGNSSYNSLQISADRRYQNGLKVGFAYTLGKSEDNASNKRTSSGTPTTTPIYLGAVGLRPPARAERLLHLRPAVLARPDHADAQPARRLAGRPARRSSARARRSRCFAPTTSPAWATADSASRTTWSATPTRARTRSSRPPSATGTSGSTRRRLPPRRPARSATRRAISSAIRASSSGTSRSSRTSTSAARAARSSGPSSSTSRITRTGRHTATRRAANQCAAGPGLGRSEQRGLRARHAEERRARDIQLSLRFLF